MEEIEHSHGDFLVIVVAVLEEVVQGVGVEERGNRDEPAAFLDAAPGQELLVEGLDVLLGGVVLLHDAAKLEVLLAIGVDILKKLLVFQIVDVLVDQAVCRFGAFQGVVHFQRDNDEKNQAQDNPGRL